MEELKNNISAKLVKYRKAAKLTQLEVAEKLCYSDKSISKWERGESIPDVAVLNKLAEVYGVTLEDIISDHQQEQSSPTKTSKKVSFVSILKQRNFLISIISILAVWTLATIVFVGIKIIWPNTQHVWLAFIYAIPASFALAFAFCEKWSTDLFRCLALSGFIWTMVVALFLTMPTANMWLLFMIPIPVQAMVIVWFVFKIQIINTYKKITTQKNSKENP